MWRPRIRKPPRDGYLNSMDMIIEILDEQVFCRIPQICY